MSAAQPPILVVDIETTSDDRLNAGIVEIGSIWLHPAYAPKSLWFEVKCRPYDGAPIQESALKVNGCDWHQDPTVASEKEAVELFGDFIAGSLNLSELQPNSLIMAGMNIGVFDWPILRAAFARASEDFPFSFRTLDLHSVGMMDALKSGIDDIDGSGMKSGDILEMLCLPQEPKPHRALCGALLEHRALWELLGGAPPLYDLGALEARFFPAVETPCAQ